MSLRRFASFGTIGAGIFAAGFLLLFVLVSILGMNETAAYLIQAVVSVASSFLLNWKITWKDHKADFRRSAARFAMMTAFSIPFNTIVFSILVKFGVYYLIANVITLALFTVIKYVLSHRWVFVPAKDSEEATSAVHPA